MTDDEFLQAFMDCTLPNDQFHHRDHLRLAWLLGRRLGCEGASVAIADGSSVEVNAIVHATGFEPATDFLPEDARPTADGLYRGVVHPNVGGLYFVGLVEAHRALLPIAEQQAAWTADALTGRVAIPTPEERRRVAVEASRRRARDFGDRHPFMVDYARYLATLRRDRRAARA